MAKGVADFIARYQPDEVIAVPDLRSMPRGSVFRDSQRASAGLASAGCAVERQIGGGGGGLMAAWPACMSAKGAGVA